MLIRLESECSPPSGWFDQTRKLQSGSDLLEVALNLLLRLYSGDVKDATFLFFFIVLFRCTSFTAFGVVALGMIGWLVFILPDWVAHLAREIFIVL